MRTGRNKFNTNPKDVTVPAYTVTDFSNFLSLSSSQGIKFLQTQGMLQETAESVAQFLFKGELLNKRKIGNYLGEG